MRIIRPQQLIVIKGSYQLGNESRLGISVIAGCYLSIPEHFVSEAQIWDAWKRAPLSFPVLDAAEPKPFAEYLIAGHAGIGQPVKTLNASADIGGRKRCWRVEGEGIRGTLEMDSFLSVPLDHSSAWGGKEYKDNPLGRGYNDGLRPLLMTLSDESSVQERSPLAAPAPVPHEFALRKAHIDKVAGQMAGRDYLETVFPGLPVNIDRRYFQMAPPAQWLPEEEWPDRVPFELQGLGGQSEAIRGELPAVRGRAFIRRHDSDGLEEIVLQRKTLWFLPDSDIALIIFTGSAPLTHLLDESIESIMLALDRCDELRSFDYFQQVRHKRSDNAASPFEFLLDPDLMPVNMGLNIIESADDHPNSLQYDPAPTSRDAAAAFYKRIHDAIALPPSPEIESIDWGSFPERVNDNQLNLHCHQTLLFEGESFIGICLNGPLSGKTFRQCHFSRCDFSQMTLNDCIFEHCSFEKLNLTQSQLLNIRMTHCTLLGGRLTESYFRNASFEQVSFDTVSGHRMHVEHSNLTHCTFSQGELTASRFEDCTICNGIFNETAITKAKFILGSVDSSVFNLCVADETVWRDIVLSKSSLLGGIWRNVNFDRCRIESMTAGMQVDFADGVYNDCCFIKAGFMQAKITGCQLFHCAFTESNFDQADFTHSYITRCDMAGARFKDSVLTHTKWQNTSVQQAMFYNADLRGAIFEQCNLAAANLAMAWLDVDTLFTDCLLERLCWQPRRVIKREIYTHDNQKRQEST
ncbi:TPA: pentapeptide repeat-containing protein [Serratia liquefaciens]